LRRIDGSMHPVALSNWFTLPNPDLNLDEEERTVSPREWLLSGGPCGFSYPSPKSFRKRMAKLPELSPAVAMRGISPDVETLPAGTRLYRIYFRGGEHPRGPEPPPT
jgi:hypothetical protein